MGVIMERPVNSFLLFCKTKRNDLTNAYPQHNNSEITSMLGVCWRNLPKEEKLEFKQKAEEYKEKFQKENPNYKPTKKAEQNFMTSFRLSPPNINKMSAESKTITKTKSQSKKSNLLALLPELDEKFYEYLEKNLLLHCYPEYSSINRA